MVTVNIQSESEESDGFDEEEWKNEFESKMSNMVQEEDMDQLVLQK